MSHENALGRISQPLAPEEEEFVALIVEHFDAAYYLEKYNDVAQSGVDPLEHWLDQGAREGRQISTSIDLRYGKIGRRSSNRNWKHYRWRGQDIAIRLIKPIPPDVLAQILNQARHDPEVLSAGLNTITNLAHRESVGQIDVAGLQRAVRHDAEFLVMVPNLSTSGDQRFVADLVAGLSEADFRSVQTIVVDEESPESFDEFAIPEPFRTTDVLFWQDFWIHNPGVSRLAQLVRILRPRVTIVANSRHGHEMVVRFGPALSERTKMYCIFTDAAQGHDFDVRFPRRTLPFATGLTDDINLATRLREQYGDLLGHGVEVLPRDSPAAFRDAVAALFGRP